MRQSVIRITTHDTKEVFEYPGENPRLWDVQIKIARVNHQGQSNTDDRFTIPSAKVFLTEGTMRKFGLVPQQTKVKEVPHTQSTAEDLLLELLSLVGVYPTE
ncbi:MAG: hypothetical protein P1P84_02820 [Deferrisomatales bacterium]|nr:hypothetical protein [Deferrisomatales bacterium]